MILVPVQPLPNWPFEIVKLSMFILGSELQICNSVIRSLVIPMMNFLSISKISTKVLFHYQSMFQDIPTMISKWMLRRIDCYISTRYNSSSSFPIWMSVAYIDTATNLKVTCITMSTNEHYWLMLFVIPTLYFYAATTCTNSQESSNGGVVL